MFELTHFDGKFHLYETIEDDVICAVEVSRAYGREGIDEFQCTYRVFVFNRSERDDIEIVSDAEWDQRLADVIAHEGEEKADEWIDLVLFDCVGQSRSKYTQQAWKVAQENIKKFKALLALGVFTIPINLI